MNDDEGRSSSDSLLRQENPDLARLIDLAERKFKQTGFDRRVADVVALYGEHWVTKALARPVREWGGILTILANWKLEGGPLEPQAPRPTPPPAQAHIDPATSWLRSADKAGFRIELGEAGQVILIDPPIPPRESSSAVLERLEAVQLRILERDRQALERRLPELGDAVARALEARRS